jgi:prepilin-type N-terminal cleavage/methylation domain-containing protein/prepilin-type processing-associated H-X9-DG protein
VTARCAVFHVGIAMAVPARVLFFGGTLMKRRGFTLIELLVVVAIIALLIAILLPSLGRAKAVAVRVKCASVLRQWGQVVAMYEAEYNGVWAIKFNGQGWNSTASGYGTEWASKYNSVMRTCPGDPTAANTGTTLYCMVRPAPLVSNVVQWNISQVHSPSTLVLMSDSDQVQSGQNPWFTSLADPPMVNLKTALDNRHRGVGNVLFMDSHVDPAKYSDYVDNVPSMLNGLNVPDAESNKRWTTLR